MRARNHCGDTEVICKSQCNANEKNGCKLGMPCANRELILASQFCDFTSDCCGYSSEYDYVAMAFNALETIFIYLKLICAAAHCKNCSDLRFQINCSWFECFDNLFIISLEQVCD